MPVANLQLSARNQIRGSITDVKSGQVMSLVTIRTGDQQFVSAVTNEAVKELGLKLNDQVVAVVKASEPILVKGDEGQVKFSARNKILGHVIGVQKGTAMAAVTVKSGDFELTTSITRLALDELDLNNGDRLTVAFKASAVLLQKA